MNLVLISRRFPFNEYPLLMYRTTQKLPLLLAFLFTAFLMISCSDDATSPDIDDEIPDTQAEAIIILDNEGSSSYVIADIDGDGADGEVGESNGTITLETGGRYSFVNDGGASSHPLDFRNSDSDKLLGQSNSSGSFDDDENVNVTMDGDVITFTLTDELADELHDYVCSFHPSMTGQFTIE